VTDRPTLLYILAPSFSGSTLLTYLLAQHAEIATVGELKATQMGPPEDYHCSCGEPILDCEFWKSMQEEADAAGIPFAIDNFGTVFDGRGAVSDKIVRATVRGGLSKSDPLRCTHSRASVVGWTPYLRTTENSRILSASFRAGKFFSMARKMLFDSCT